MIKIVVADDSAFMRKAISMIVEKDPEIKVVGVARNGEEAVEKVKSLKPDVLTLDIEMPVMDGLKALEIIIEKCPLPVLMVSSIAKENADVTLRALELGAADYIPKNLSFVSLDIVKMEKEIIAKVKHIAKKGYIPRKKVTRSAPTVARKISAEPHKYLNNYRIITIGSSTGGPGALQDVLTPLPGDLPCSIVIAQHMPAGFTKAFADRLDKISKINVKEAEDGERLERATAYISPGNKNTVIVRRGSKVFIHSGGDLADTIYKPSANTLIGSVADVYGGSTIGVIMTGMGNDGLEGMRKVKNRNGYTIAQDEATSIIYGMPKAVVDEGLADEVRPLHEIPEAILNIL